MYRVYDNCRNSRSLMNMNMKFVQSVSKREWEIRKSVIVKKQIDVSF